MGFNSAFKGLKFVSFSFFLFFGSECVIFISLSIHIVYIALYTSILIILILFTNFLYCWTRLGIVFLEVWGLILFHRFHFYFVVLYFSLQLFLKIQSVPLPTKPGISLIILKPMKILQRDLNRSTFVVWEMNRTVSVVCNIFIDFRIIKEMPCLVGSGTPYIYSTRSIVLTLHFFLSKLNILIPKLAVLMLLRNPSSEFCY